MYLCRRTRSFTEQHMELQTSVLLDAPAFGIDYHTRIMMVGSCFVENIGQKLAYYRYRVDTNPCGIVYNPQSVAMTLKFLRDGRHLEAADLLKCGSKWVSLAHHGQFSDTDAGACLQKINKRLEQSAAFLREADVLAITWGTAWVFRHLPSGNIAANCHKLPASDFERFRLGIEEIVEEYVTLLTSLRKLNPHLKYMLTVSPIRHWKDGAHGNQLSKAVLLLAAEELTRRIPEAVYFPSYEIVMDELRDYRFYAEDMLHISPQAINYIWEKFTGLYMTPEARHIMKRVDKLNKQLLHRPLDPTDNTSLRLKRQAEQELRELGFEI